MPETHLIGEPHMGQSARSYLQTRLAYCTVFLEYGSGGSTLYATTDNGPDRIYSVDNHPQYIATLQKQIPQEKSDRVKLIYVDLGLVRNWGFLRNKANLRRSWIYPQRPWQLMEQDKVTPDFVLIDGRFRMACFLTCLIKGLPGTEIMVDDYTERPRLKNIEKYCTPESVFEKTAVFKIPETRFDMNEMALDLARYTADEW